MNPLEGQDNIYWQETLAPVEKAKRYIMENLAARLTLAEVAGECGVSKYHFSRIFKAAKRKAPEPQVGSRILIFIMALKKEFIKSEPS